MKMNKIVKVTLLMLVVSINHGICADYTSIENELPEIEDPVDPQEPDPALNRNRSRHDTFYLNLPNYKYKLVNPSSPPLPGTQLNGIKIGCVHKDYEVGIIEFTLCGNDADSATSTCPQDEINRVCDGAYSITIESTNDC